MTKLRIIAFIVLAVIALMLVIQNTEPVETRLLIVTVTMPRALLLLVTLLIGYVLGVASVGFFFGGGSSSTD